MSIRNPHWYNLNEGRDYPLDDVATGRSDAGDRLPQNLITDLRVRWPSVLGQYAFVSAASVTPNAVTVVLQASSTFDNVEGANAPLAAITLTRQELEEGRQYLMESQYPGASAYIVFGSGANAADFSGRFSSPSQTMLTPRAARATRGLPVTSLGALHENTGLTGIVSLLGRDPIEVVSESREIEGEEQDVIVVRLVDNPITTAGVEDTVFAEFAGPCAGRPESGSCGDPQPIEFIANVAPDCDGVLEIEFKNCAEIGQNIDECGVVVDCGMSLSQTCLPPYLPNDEGLLPSEYDPVPVIPPEESQPPIPEDESISVSVTVVGELPYEDCFEEGATYFMVQKGQFTVSERFSIDQPCLVQGPQGAQGAQIQVSDGPSYATEGERSAGTYNVSTWEGFDVTTLYRKVTTDIFLSSDSPANARHNGGIVINYRPHASVANRFVYFIAEIDYEDQEFRLRRFNGTTYQPIVSVPIFGLLRDHWYRLTASVRPHTVETCEIVTTLEDLNPPEETVTPIEATIGPVYVNNYYPDVGYFGFGSNRAWTSFSFFRLEEYT